MDDFWINLFTYRSAKRNDYTDVSYSDGCFIFLEVTDWSDNDDEECYGMILDKEESDKLIRILTADGKDLQEAVKEKFDGTNILYPVEDFLKENGIQYRWSGNKYELGC